MKQLSKATRTVYTILRQMATLIPREFVKNAAEAHKVKYRTFDPWSHLMTLVVVQLSRQESLNGICDIAHLLLRYVKHGAEWKHSFSRLAGVVRGSLCLKKRLMSLRHTVKTPYFQPFLHFANAPNGTASA